MSQKTKAELETARNEIKRLEATIDDLMDEKNRLLERIYILQDSFRRVIDAIADEDAI